eukprot:SM000002S05670  [mRNA]  locus=s2:1423401:1424371:+ [translate_table: standard]
MVRVNLEFSGGLELLVSGCKVHQADIEAAATDGKPPPIVGPRLRASAAHRLQFRSATPLLTVGAVLLWVRDHLLTERPEMLLKGQSV